VLIRDCMELNMNVVEAIRPADAPEASICACTVKDLKKADACVDFSADACSLCSREFSLIFPRVCGCSHSCVEYNDMLAHVDSGIQQSGLVCGAR
jgi:hypothetical protein